MKNTFLYIKLLRYILKKDGSFGQVEIKDFLLKYFPKNDQFLDRKRMKNFLNFLGSEEYIDLQSTKGILIYQEAGKTIDRKDISAIVKIKPKGVEVLENHQTNFYNRLGVVVSIFFLISTIILGLYNIQMNKDLVDTNQSLEKSKKDLKVVERKLDLTKDTLFQLEASFDNLIDHFKSEAPEAFRAFSKDSIPNKRKEF